MCIQEGSRLGHHQGCAMPQFPLFVRANIVCDSAPSIRERQVRCCRGFSSSLHFVCLCSGVLPRSHVSEIETRDLEKHQSLSYIIRCWRFRSSTRTLFRRCVGERGASNPSKACMASITWAASSNWSRRPCRIRTSSASPFREVGDSFQGLDGKDEQSFESTVRSGFSYSRIMSDPNILLAPRSSCVIALRGDVVICEHGVFENLTSGDPRRNAQWVDIICPDATAMRLVNSHQPSSELNPYPWKYRHDVCTGIFRRAEHKFSFFLSVS